MINPDYSTQFLGKKVLVIIDRPKEARILLLYTGLSQK